MKTFKSLLILTAFVAASGQWGSAQEPAVHVEQENLKGPRVLQEQTKAAVVRDYLQCWQSFRAALEQNRTDLLGTDFVGTAKEKLTETVEQQAAAGIHTRYRDLSHDLQIVFYSPEGLSVEMTDAVAYDVQVIDHDKVAATQHVIAKYIVVMTPSEVNWRVRVLQALPN
jgi:hypothetical protein